MSTSPRMTAEEAVRWLRADPRHAELVRNTYLDSDVLAAAERFGQSGEWKATARLLRSHLDHATVVDVGAGSGIASAAFVRAGATRVLAVEPDASEEIGRSAICRVCAGLPVEAVAAFAEEMPLPDQCADIVYARQVLHHTSNLDRALKECARVLRPGGLFLACREHVAETPAELADFLAGHAVHQLTGGENAYRLADYRRAILCAGLELQREFGSFDTVINLFPTIDSDDDVSRVTEIIARARFGRIGAIATRIPVIRALAERRLKRPRPGRLYSFLARKS